MEQSLHDALKNKMGRPLAISTPEIMRQEANDYFEWCDNNPFQDEDFVGKDATSVIRKRRRPYTIMGLCCWLGLSHDAFTNYKERKDFVGIVHDIITKIQTQQLEGAAAGHFNNNIVARLLGLSDNVNNNNTVSHAVAPEVLSELASILRKGE